MAKGDNPNGISVYQVGRSDNYATVQVSFGCAPLPPQVSMAPATLTIRPGPSASFNVSVTNQDSGGCGAGSFLVDDEGDLPGSVAPNVMTLSAGETGAAGLTANASGAADGLSGSCSSQSGRSPGSGPAPLPGPRTGSCTRRRRRGSSSPV